MGYNTAFLMIEGVTVAGAAGLLDSLFDAADLFAAAGSEVDYERACSQALDPDLALGAARGWAVFWNPNARLAQSDFPRMASRGRRVLVGLLGSADSRYEFCYYVNGVSRRSVTYAGGEVREESGTALPEEGDLSMPTWGPDEEFVFGIMSRLTGVSQADLQAATYQVLEFLG